MELITILSTIILVATISTFILSVGAYILYKIRSRREKKPVLSPIGPSKGELIMVNEEDIEAYNQEVSIKNNQKPKFASNEYDVSKAPKRLVKTEDRTQSSRPYTSRFTKYSAERLSQFDNDNPSGELKWR